MAFMGNEFGHPEWIDFPTERNGRSYLHCRRQWHLADDPLLLYHDLGKFDEEMMGLDNLLGFGAYWRTLYAFYNEGDRVLSFDGNGVCVVFNFNSTRV